MTALDPALCARLVGEAREDDECLRVLEGPGRAPWRAVEAKGQRFATGLRHYVTCIPVGHACWSGDDMTSWSRLGIWTSEGVTEPEFAAAIARTRNNLRALADQLEAALAEVARMRPVIDAAVRVAELDEICEAHPRIDDEAGNQAERDLPAAVLARKDAIDACRKAKP